MVPLENLSDFWRNLEMALIDCETKLILTWSVDCFIVASTVGNQSLKFPISDTKLYISVVTLSTQDNAITIIEIRFYENN